MAFSLVDHQDDKSFTFSPQVVSEIEVKFAKNFRKQCFTRFAVNGEDKESFLNDFYKDSPYEYRVLGDLVIDNRLSYSSDEIGALKNAKVLISDGGNFKVVESAIDYLLEKLEESPKYTFFDAMAVTAAKK